MRRWTWACAWSLVVATTGCNTSVGPNGGGNDPARSDIMVLNSLSKTLLQFTLTDGQLVPFGEAIQLGPNFDGVTADFVEDLWVTTTSAFGGSQIIFGSFSTGEQLTVTFPGVDSELADAGKPTVVIDAGGTIAAFVPARGRDQVYIAFPGNAEAILLIENVGTFVVRAVPAGDFILSIDANLDDEGGTFAPLGPPRIVLHDFQSGSFFSATSLPGSLGATEALVVSDEMALLAGGSFDPVTFAPMGDGSLLRINISDQGIQNNFPIGGNGLSFEPGRNGLGYIVRTKGAGSFDDTDVLRFNFFTGEFERGPNNPLQPKDSDGSDLSCRVVTAFATGQLLCATFEASSVGRLVLLDADGTYAAETPIGAGATDIIIR